MTASNVSIIIPAFNEAQTIGAIVERLKTLYPDYEVVVIDDGSSDDTAKTAEKAGAEVYQHPYNIGNGAAVKSGIRVASGDILVFMDGDGQHDPADVQRLLERMPEFDMVVGTRNLFGQTSFLRALGNTIFNLFSSYAANFKIRDLTSGFRAIKADIARSFLYLLPNTYSYPTTITLGVLRSGRSVEYIPIQFNKRKTGSSNIRLIQDGVRFFMIITRIATMYSPMRVFIPVSLAMFGMGFLRYVYTFFMERRFTNMSALLFVSAVIIFMMSLISEQICQLRFERRSAPRARRREDTTGRN